MWRAIKAHDGRHWRQDPPGLLVNMKETLETFKLSLLRGINLKVTIQTEQLDLQKAFK